MARIRYTTCNADTLCTTNLSEETIGTNTLTSEATDILGFYITSGSTGTTTAGEAIQNKFIIKPGSLAPEDIEVYGGTAYGGGPATNIMSVVDMPKWIPFAPTAGLSLSNKKITCKIDSVLPEPTAEAFAQFTVVYSEGTIPNIADIMSNVGRIRSRVRWIGCTADHDVGATAGGDAFPGTITVPGWVSEIVGMTITLGMDAAGTAGEHVGGYITVDSTAGDMGDIQVPFPTIGAPLGTTVGGQDVCPEFACPLYVDLPDNDVTFKFNTNLHQALSDKVVIAVSIYGR